MIDTTSHMLGSVKPYRRQVRLYYRVENVTRCFCLINSHTGGHFHWQIRLGAFCHQRRRLPRLLHLHHRPSSTPHDHRRSFYPGDGTEYTHWFDITPTNGRHRHLQGFGEPRCVYFEWQSRHVIKIQRQRDRPRFPRLQSIDGGASLFGRRAGNVA